MENQNILTVKDLELKFSTVKGTVYALNGVSFSVGRKESLGIVGESGCGKSITSLGIMGLLPKNAEILKGSILFRNKQGAVIDISKLERNGEVIRKIRGAEISMIFQEPMTSLNPVHKIGKQLREVIMLHQNVKKHEANEIALEMLKNVEISAPEQRLKEYPHQLSGGMRQRIMIALALSCNPSLLIADEPTTSLDVTIEAQILRLIKNIQKSREMSLLLITHNLGLIWEYTDRIVVVYMGEILEEIYSKDVFSAAKHPYTLGLLKARPQIGRKDRLVPIEGTVPSLYQRQKGCPFSDRCGQVLQVCYTEKPKTIQIAPGHLVKCFLYQE